MSKWLRSLFLGAVHLQASTFWQDPVSVSSVSIASTIQTLNSAMNDKGDAIVIWGYDSVGNPGGTFSSYRLASQTTWRAPETLATVGAGTSAFRPIKVVLDNSGIASVIFVKNNNSVGLTRLTLGGSWDTPVIFSPLGSMSTVNDAEITLDSNQVPIAIFTQGRNVYYTSYISGAWQTPSLLASDSGNGYPSNISGSPGGDVVAVWEMDDMMGRSFYEFSTRINGVWSTPMLVASYQSAVFSPPKIVGGPLNRFLFQATEVYPGAPTTYAMGVAQGVSPQTTSDWIKSSLGSVSANDTASTSFALSINSSGAALSFWSSGNGSTLQSNYWTSSATAPALTSTITSGSGLTNLRGVIEKNGIGIAVWKQGTTIQSSNNLDGSSWGAQENISFANPITNRLNSLSTSLGKVASFVFWIENDGTDNTIYSRKHPIVTPPTPPLSGQGQNFVNRFATQGYVINQFSWSPSADPDVESYSVYADSDLLQFLGNVLAGSPLTFTTGIVSPYIPHSYFVVAVKEEIYTSTPLTITIPSYK